MIKDIMIMIKWESNASFYMKDNIVRYSICFHRPQGTLFENQYFNILLA